MSVQHKDWYTSTDVGVRIENSNGPVVTTDEVAVEITGTQAHKSFKSLTDALEEKLDVGAAVTSVEYDGTTKKIVAYKGTTPTDVVAVSTIKTDLLLAKGDVGLGNVDNTADADKPISTATQTALNAKVSQTAFDGHVNDTDNPHQVTAAQVGLGNVDNTPDTEKDVNSAVKDGDGNVITETYETIALAGTSHTTLQGNIDAVSAIVQNLTGLEGTNFGGFSLDAVEATAISNIATIYTNAGYTSGDVYWFLAGTDMSALKAYRYDGSGSPVAISSTVYDFTDFSGLLTLVSSYRGNTNDLDSLNTLASAGTYQYISGSKMGLVSVSYDTAHSAATQIWLSDVIPDEADPTIWNEGPAILMRTYSNSTWSAWQNPIAKNAADIAALGPKTSNIQKEFTTDSAEEQVWSDDSGTDEYAKISSNGVWGKNLKYQDGSSVKDVKTELGGKMPLKTIDAVPTENSTNLISSGGVFKATKPLSRFREEDISTWDGEQTWSSDDGSEDFVKINKNGIYAKVYHYIDGSDPFEGNRKVMTINTTDTEIEILEKLLLCVRDGNYDVYWETGTYTFSDIYIYMRDTLNWTWTMELPIGNGCRYYFQNSTIISNPPSAEYNTSRSIFGCKAGGAIAWNGSSFTPSSLSYELYDGFLVNNGGTYCVHDEMNTNTSYYRHIYRNMRMKYVEQSMSEYLSKCIGGGAGCNGLIVIEDCSFQMVEDSTLTGKSYQHLDNDVTWHVSNNSTDDETMIYFIDGNYFSKGFRISSVTAVKTSYYYAKFSNNSVLSAANIILNADDTFSFNNNTRG